MAHEHRAGEWPLAERRASREELAELAGQWKERGKRDHEKLKRMEAYCRSALCRWLLPHDYFEEPMVEGGVAPATTAGVAWLSVPNSR